MDNKRLKQLALENMLSGGGVSTYTISGTVYDADGTTAVEGATVALGALSAISAANGTYTIADVPAGTSGSMTCTKTGYSWTAITIAAMSGNLTSQNYTNAWWAATGIAASCTGAYQGIGAANVAASQVNLANPGTNDLTVPSGQTQPTWNAATGWSATQAAPKFWDTGIIPDPLNASWIARVSSAATLDENALFGVWTNDFSKHTFFYTQLNATNSQYSMNSAAVYGTVLTTGTAGQGNSDFFNGSAIRAAGRNTATFSEGLWLMGTHREGGAYHRTFEGNLLAIAFYSSKLSDAVMTALSAAIANLT